MGWAGAKQLDVHFCYGLIPQLLNWISWIRSEECRRYLCQKAVYKTTSDFMDIEKASATFKYNQFIFLTIDKIARSQEKTLLLLRDVFRVRRVQASTA